MHNTSLPNTNNNISPIIEISNEKDQTPANDEHKTNENIYKTKAKNFFSKEILKTHTMKEDLLQSTSKHLDKNNIQNQQNAKLASLIRKKYTLLLKQNIISDTTKAFTMKHLYEQITKKVYLKMVGTIIQAVISLIAVIVYIISTYYPEKYETNNATQRRVIENLQLAELIISVVIAVDYIICFILSKNKIKFILHPLNILDLINLVPAILHILNITNKSIGFIRIFRIIRIMRIFRLRKILNNNNIKDKDNERNESMRRLISSVLSILAVVLIGSGIIQFLTDTFPSYFSLRISGLDVDACENGSDFTTSEITPFYEGVNISLSCSHGVAYVHKEANITFDIALYYMVITMATVGYGDIYPQTSLMRLVVSVIVFCSIIAISQLEISDLLKLNSQYVNEYKHRKGCKHIILSGFFSKNSLNKFLTEFYHEDHKEKTKHLKIVIIQNELPSKDIQSILLNPKYEENLHYLKGDIFSEKTLSYAKVSQADAVILQTEHNELSVNDNDDNFLILACKALSQITPAPIYVKFHNTQSLLHDWADWDLACSSQQIKMSIMIKNGFVSGFSTMIMNLTSSISSNIYAKGFGNTPWMLEYLEGASQELYIVQPPSDFKAIEFTKFVEIAYVNFGSLPLGVRKKVESSEDEELVYYTYILNPVDYCVTKEDQVIVISDDFEMAKMIFNEPQHTKIMKRRECNNNNNNNTESHIIKYNSGNNNGDSVESCNYYDTSQINTSNIEDNLNYLQDNFRDENTNDNVVKRHYTNHDIIKQSAKKPQQTQSTLTLMYNEHEEDLIPQEFIKKKRHIKIWETSKKELTYLTNHYLVFCKEDQLEEFITCFNCYLHQPLYFVTDQQPGNKWEILSTSFKNIICIESSYSDQEHLNKLHLNKCKHAYILTYAVENSSVLDSGILPLVKLIEENYEKCKYTLELADELNVRYLSSKYIIEDEQQQTTTTTEMNVVSNDTTINNSNSSSSNNKKIPVRLWPKYAKSDIFFSSSLDSLMAFSYHNKGTLDIILKLLGIRNGSYNGDNYYNDIETNYDIGIYRYIGRTDMRTEYETIMKYFLLLTPPVIPIAVYRCVDNKTCLQNEMPYIITNPKKDLEINQYDQVICVGKAKKGFFAKLKPDDIDNESESDYNDSDYNGSQSKEGDSYNNEIIIKDKCDELTYLTERQLLERLSNELNYFHLGNHIRMNTLQEDRNSHINMSRFGFSTCDKIEEDEKHSSLNSSLHLNLRKQSSCERIINFSHSSSSCNSSFNSSKSSKKDKIGNVSNVNMINGRLLKKRSSSLCGGIRRDSVGCGNEVMDVKSRRSSRCSTLKIKQISEMFVKGLLEDKKVNRKKSVSVDMVVQGSGGKGEVISEEEGEEKENCNVKDFNNEEDGEVKEVYKDDGCVVIKKKELDIPKDYINNMKRKKKKKNVIKTSKENTFKPKITTKNQLRKLYEKK